MAKNPKRLLAVFQGRKYRKIGDFILKVRTLILNFVSNPLMFPAPLPIVADITKHTDDLEEAQAKALTRVVGSTAERDIKYDQVVDDVNHWLGYVQGLADNTNDEAIAISIIETSGFDLKKRGVRVKAPIAVKQGDVSGSVKLVARAQGRAGYQWQKSLDGLAFENLPATLQAKTTVEGFAPGTAAYFRYRPITKAGEGNWSNVVSLIVI
jgi:hypothetical protein